MAKYDRKIIIQRLEQNGLKPKYRKGTKFIQHFECSEDKPVGIKLWGYLDFLNTPLVRKKRKSKKEKKKFIPLIKPIGKIFHFVWFALQEQAQAWISIAREVWKGKIIKADVHLTEFGEYRGTVERRNV